MSTRCNTTTFKICKRLTFSSNQSSRKLRIRSYSVLILNWLRILNWKQETTINLCQSATWTKLQSTIFQRMKSNISKSTSIKCRSISIRHQLLIIRATLSQPTKLVREEETIIIVVTTEIILWTTTITMKELEEAHSQEILKRKTMALILSLEEATLVMDEGH